MIYLLHALLLVSTVTASFAPKDTYMPPKPRHGTRKSRVKPGKYRVNKQWKTVLGNSLYFFDSQRAGNLNAGEYPNRVPWRNNTVPNDGLDVGADLSGGFWDAGNAIKCTFPFTFTMFAMSWGALSYGPGFDKAKQTKYLDSNLRWGFDWLMNAHLPGGDLVVQVGDSQVVNGHWGGDQTLPTPRPSYVLNKTAPGTDAWASTAAAFALGSLAYSGQTWNTSKDAYAPASLADKAYSEKLLCEAKSLYDTAVNTKPYAVYSDSIPAMNEAYGSSYYTDDLVTSAISLAAATGDGAYYKDAYNFYTAFQLSHNESMWGWESRLPAAYVMFAELAHARPEIAISAGLEPNVTGWQEECEYYFDNIVDNKLKNGTITPGGLLTYGQLSNLNSLQPALAAAHLLFRYAPMASSPEKRGKYESFAQSQVDYWLGKNPMNAPYMIGIHPNAPLLPHNSMASGINMDEDNWCDECIANLTKPAHTLYGAVVGGPLVTAKNVDKYWDDLSDWQMGEPSLDYAANAPVLAAYEICKGAGDPYYVNLEVKPFKSPEGKACSFAVPCDNHTDTELYLEKTEFKLTPLPESKGLPTLGAGGNSTAKPEKDCNCKDKHKSVKVDGIAGGKKEEGKEEPCDDDTEHKTPESTSATESAGSPTSTETKPKEIAKPEESKKPEEGKKPEESKKPEETTGAAKPQETSKPEVKKDDKPEEKKDDKPEEKKDGKSEEKKEDKPEEYKEEDKAQETCPNGNCVRQFNERAAAIKRARLAAGGKRSVRAKHSRRMTLGRLYAGRT